MKQLSRREVLLAGLGLAVTGCVSATGTSRSAMTLPASQRPGPLWPEGTSRPVPASEVHTTAPAYSGNTARKPYAPPAATPTAGSLLPGGVIPRTTWTRTGLASKSIKAMAGVTALTIHHEGWTPVNFTAAADTYDRLEKIRQIHTRDRGWADIGYHYIVDRAGRILQGRDVRYQGAHVSEHNEHNLGVLVLGNFSQQKPSNEQLAALGRFVALQMKTFRIAKSRVYTHQELMPTECPGRHLQAQVNLMRRNGTLV